MKRGYFFSVIAFLVFFPLTMFCQHHFEWGKELVSKPLTPFKDIVTVNENIFIANDFNDMAYKSPKAYHHIAFQRIGADLKIKKSVPQELYYKKDKLRFIQLLTFGDRLFFLGHHPNKRGKDFKAICEIDENTLLPGDKCFMFLDESGNPFIWIQDNPGVKQSKMVIVTQTVFRDSSLFCELNFIILNDQLVPEFEQKINLPLQSNQFDIRSVELDDSGNIIMAGLERPKIKGLGVLNVTSLTESIGHIFKVNTHNALVEHIELGDDDSFFLKGARKYIKDIYCTVQDDDILITGIYSENEWNPKTSLQSSKGIFSFRSSGVPLKKNEIVFTPIGNEIAKNLPEMIEAKKLDKQETPNEIPGLVIKQIIPLNGQGFLIITEMSADFISSQTSFHYPSNSSSFSSYYLRVSKDVVVFNCTKNGELIWQNNIQKLAFGDRTEKPTPDSYFMVIREEEISFFYLGPSEALDENGKLTTEKSIHEFEIVSPEELFNTNMSISTGQQTFQVLETGLDDSFYICPRACIPISDNMFLLYAKKGMKGMLGIMEFE